MYVNLNRLLQLTRRVLQPQPNHRVISATPPNLKAGKCNLSDTSKFEFTAENKCRAQELLSHYPENEMRGALLPLLDIAQRQHGWLPITAIQAVASLLKLEPFAVWEVASFYTMFNLTPVGKFHIKVCMTTPCQLRGCAQILQKCEELLHLKAGETSEDMEFTLKTTYCIGACVHAPVMTVNDDLYEDLHIKDVENILCQLKAGNVPPCGPRKGRFANEPSSGVTTLFIEPPPAGYGMQDICKPKTKHC
ncbi:NADH-quinone oxidoreductase subunit E [Drosophila grimshawi]|uniref:GH14917 n=1 Tax=Drosophila grimshawi TaxID=7222 RepID=B4J237_DROGR|nr:NADH-quinone oxidoreductase subunit E [Drosophila grimshawi]EDV96988.1 GH14917 [Drosophila grimshawi]